MYLQHICNQLLISCECVHHKSIPRFFPLFNMTHIINVQLWSFCLAARSHIYRKVLSTHVKSGGLCWQPGNLWRTRQVLQNGGSCLNPWYAILASTLAWAPLRRDFLKCQWSLQHLIQQRALEHSSRISFMLQRGTIALEGKKLLKEDWLV